jgi:hypothetical protein
VEGHVDGCALADFADDAAGSEANHSGPRQSARAQVIVKSLAQSVAINVLKR